MNNKGFTLVELLGCLVLLVTILSIGLYSARGTLARTFSVLDTVSEEEVYNASEMYVLEYDVKWNNGEEEYVCLTFRDLVDRGYFNINEVNQDIDEDIKVTRDSETKVVNKVEIVDVCE